MGNIHSEYFFEFEFSLLWCYKLCGMLANNINKILALSLVIPSHLSPGFSFIYDLVHDSGMLQSELFTSRNQNLVLAKLPNSGFWRYGQFFKWNRVKMAKNGKKIVDIFLGVSHMINNNIFNIFCFLTFFLGTLQTLHFG